MKNVENEKKNLTLSNIFNVLNKALSEQDKYLKLLQYFKLILTLVENKYLQD